MISRLRLGIAALLCTSALLSTPQSIAAADACTVTIPPSVDKVDGTADYTNVGPGSVLCLPAGTRGNLKLLNLRGSAAAPIVVRNEGGTTVITGTDFKDGGIIIEGSSFLHVTGTGVGEQCGSEYRTADQHCGIEIDGARKGIKLNTDHGDLHDIEIDHVGILQVSTDVRTRGIAIHPLEGQTIGGISIHHCYVANTLAEGIYIGSEPRSVSFAQLAKLERVHIHHNLVENTGFDGIKLKVAVRDVSVHHNVVHNAGISRTPAHEGGIKVALSVGDYYDNVVISAVEGIRMGRPLDAANTRYFNNLVLDTIDVGIEASEAGALVSNNVVIGVDGVGIRADGGDGVVSGNIVADTGTAMDLRNAVALRNVVGPATAPKVPDPDALRFEALMRRRLAGTLASLYVSP
jgi:hypothetical protein